MRIHRYAGSILNEGREIHLVFELDCAPFLFEFLIVGILFEFLKMALHVTNPSFADCAGNQLREPWVAEKQPSPRRDSIRDVEKFFREEFGKIVEDIAFEQFRVKCCDSVDRM